MLGIEGVCERYGVSVDKAAPVKSTGLSIETARQRLIDNGPNILAPPKRKHPIFKFFDCLKNLFNILLIVSGVLCFILYGIDTIANIQQSFVGAFLIFVAFSNAGIEFYNIQKSQSVLDSFLSMVPAKAFALREGKLQNLPAQDLVLGDIVFLRMGDKVPADIVIFASTELKVYISPTLPD